MCDVMRANLRVVACLMAGFLISETFESAAQMTASLDDAVE